MSKGQRGNKEAKKPKQAKPTVKPLTPNDTTPSAARVPALPLKKK